MLLGFYWRRALVWCAPALLAVLLFLPQSCTRQAWFEGFKEGERQRCHSQVSQDEIERCLDRVEKMHFEQYQKSREN
jgi:cyanate permease